MFSNLCRGGYTVIFLVPLCISLILNSMLDLMLLNPVLPLLAVSRRKSDVLQLDRCCPATFSHLNQNYFPQTKFVSLFASRPAWEV